ncbi:hypothetical protein AO377_0999 [Moraxella catarrhalis]|nr:hypothetical protein AO377_0999 [Moraxella catarrhalis]OAV16602.1 hypothetical protein AO375_0488 [Moraxella catarrhalis]OAV32270.1 hypothetical protein AO368_0535 [Moraxella catarrhalis]OAV36390.1 hypothetical protein AO365_0785 [Moraxella catarrhalis]
MIHQGKVLAYQTLMGYRHRPCQVVATLGDKTMKTLFKVIIIVILPILSNNAY